MSEATQNTDPKIQLILDFQNAQLHCSFAARHQDELPDGLGTELMNARREYKEHLDKQVFIDEVKNVLHSWGFPF